MKPILFIGHGSPMNAVEDNEFTRQWKEIANLIPHPKSILSISAHWETNGTFITAMEKPRTIHDFYGFPEVLSEMDYPAPGSPEFAEKIIKLAGDIEIKPEETKWGLDHGTWSILVKMYPDANIPVVQLSLDRNKSLPQHLDLARKLKSLRDEDVLILCSGNIVHNLGMVAWTGTGISEDAFDWAIGFDKWVKDTLSSGKPEEILNFSSLGKIARLAVPTADHFLPLIYFTGFLNNNEEVKFFCEKIVGGSISMRCILTQS